MVTARRALALLLAALLPACGLLIGINDLEAVPASGADSGRNETGADDGTVGDAGTEDASDAGIDVGDDAARRCDAAADPENCGRCGHSCLGGQCRDGQCEATALANGQGPVSAVALSATHVYFTAINTNLVARVPKDGGAVEPLATAPHVAVPKRIVVTDTHVYWANGDLPGWVSRCPLAGCGAAPEVFSQNGAEATGLTVDGSHAYWTDSNGDQIRRRPLDGGAEQTVVDVAGGRPMALAGGAPNAFWIVDFSASVFRSESDGGKTLVGKTGTSGREVALDDTWVYWAVANDVGDPGSLARAPRDGGVSQVLGPAFGHPRALTIDGDRVHWTAWTELADGGLVDGGIHSCPTVGCTTGRTTHASGEDRPRGLAIDTAAYYWGTGNGVKKLARP